MRSKVPRTRHLRRLLVRYGPEAVDKVGFTHNFAEHGLFVQATFVLPPTRVLRLEIEGPSKTFHLKARVIWSKRVPQQFMRTLRGGMGLELLDPGPEWIDFCDRAS